MRKISDFVKEGKIIKGSPNPAEARSLFAQAEERLKDVGKLPLSEKNASFRFEDAYEVIREALQSFLALEGYKPYSHEAVFSFALERKLLQEGEVLKADRYREIRNDINYRGKKVAAEETGEIIGFARKVIPELRRRFEMHFSNSKK
ncbi:hypothetical protein J4475_01715 [Candidatus Woesearchaeota archaeon]|nr:hypothetical protein [Candidatus Woesearchaeota archaeon]